MRHIFLSLLAYTSIVGGTVLVAPQVTVSHARVPQSFKETKAIDEAPIVCKGRARADSVESVASDTVSTTVARPGAPLVIAPTRIVVEVDEGSGGGGADAGAADLWLWSPGPGSAFGSLKVDIDDDYCRSRVLLDTSWTVSSDRRQLEVTIPHVTTRMPGVVSVWAHLWSSSFIGRLPPYEPSPYMYGLLHLNASDPILLVWHMSNLTDGTEPTVVTVDGRASNAPADNSLAATVCPGHWTPLTLCSPALVTPAQYLPESVLALALFVVAEVTTVLLQYWMPSWLPRASSPE
jgi:hypothetical protein